jgi:hypothetical protein
MLVVLLGLALGSALEWSPAPTADVSRGSEEAFAEGLHEREMIPGHGPLRWTRPRSIFRFEALPAGEAILSLNLVGHRSPVDVLANGVRVVRLDPNRSGGEFRLPALSRGDLTVELASDGFRAGGDRTLGTQLRRLTVRPVGTPPMRVSRASWLLALCGLGVFVAALSSGIPWPGAVVVAASAQGLFLALLWPNGLVRSPYAVALAWLSGWGAVLAAGFALAQRGRGRATMQWAFIAALVTWWTLGIAATSPVMIVSDVVFHANKLAAVAAGDFFPTSVTQHESVFRIPYAPALYALLSPFAKLGWDRVLLVRWGAASAGIAASAFLFWQLVPRGPAFAGCSVILLQCAPGWFLVYSYGNLSNAFAQALTVSFFAWAACRGAWLVGATLLTLACIGHLSAAIVLGVLVPLLIWRGRSVWRERTHALAIVAGLGLSAAYYLAFAPLILEQIPRLLEGGGQGHDPTRGLVGVLWLQILSAARQWGLPAAMLAALGVVSWRGDAKLPDSLGPDLRAFWWAGAVLGIAAIASPLEVRYLYALTLPLAVSGAGALVFLWERGRIGRGVAVVLALSQLAIGLAGIYEAVFLRYRP